MSSAAQVSSLGSLDDEALFGPGSSVKVVGDRTQIPAAAEEESLQQHAQEQMGRTSESEQPVGSSPEVVLPLEQEPEPPAAGHEMQRDTEEPLENFGFGDNDSDGGISMPSDDASVGGGGGLSDDEFEVISTSLSSVSPPPDPPYPSRLVLRMADYCDGTPTDFEYSWWVRLRPRSD